MPRINIEDDIYKSRAWFNLIAKVGCPERAIGCLVLAWIQAQKFWAPDKDPIPFEVWESEALNDALIDVGFAEKTKKGIYMKGSDDQFAWLIQRSEAGKNSGISRRNKKGKKKTNDRERPSTAEERLGTSISSSISISSSNSNKTPHTPHGGSSTKPQKRFRVSDEDAQKIYSEYPRKMGKKNGIEKLKREITNPTELDLLMQAVKNFRALMGRESREPEKIMYFSTFMNQWEDFLDPEVGSVEKMAIKAKPKSKSKSQEVTDHLREMWHEVNSEA